MTELEAAEGAADVTIRLGSIGWRPETTDDGYASVITADEAYIFYDDGGTFLAREGREIIVDPIPGLPNAVISLYTLGVPLGALLYQRGLPLLHASAVSVAGEAVFFAGDGGEGKSTMAAAMHARGHPVVADDLTAVWVHGERRPTVYPGFPQLSLWPESAAAALGDDPEELPILDPNSEEPDKHERRVAEGFSLEPLPLGRIYVLAGGDEIPEITPLGPREALEELIYHSFGDSDLQTAMVRARFPQYANIVRNVPIRRLRIPDSLADLPDLARLVEEDTVR